MTKTGRIEPQTVGVIGAGQMGRPICRNLLRAGFDVAAYDPSVEALEVVAAEGVQPCKSSRELAKRCEIIVAIPAFFAQVEAELLGPGGVCAAEAGPRVVIVSSSIAPHEMTGLLDPCLEAGVTLVDAPICGGEQAAISGELVWLVGGETPVVERCQPVLAACGGEIFHLGQVGSGMAGKAINNMLLWAAYIANQEALELGRRYGLAEESLVPALLGASAGNWALAHRDRLVRILWAHKDLMTVADMADAVGLDVSLSALVRERVKPYMIAQGLAGNIVTKEGSPVGRFDREGTREGEA